MQNGDGKRPRIRPAVSNRFDNSTYYEYLEKQTTSTPQAQTPGQVQRPSQPAQPPVAQPVHSDPQAHGPQKPARNRWIATIAVIAVVALIVTGGIILLGPRTGIEPASPESAPPAVATSSPETTGYQSLNEKAKRELDSIVSSSDPELKALEGMWVVQLSAKQPGNMSGDTTWDYATILDEYKQNEEKYGKLAMLKSENWSTFRLRGYWVTVIPQGYDSPEPALEKCEELGLDRDNCFAKRLSLTDGPDGATKLRD